MDEILNCNYLHFMLFCKFNELRQPCHASVFVHDLAYHAAFVEAGHAREVNCGLGVSGSFKDSPVTCH